MIFLWVTFILPEYYKNVLLSTFIITSGNPMLRTEIVGLHRSHACRKNDSYLTYTPPRINNMQSPYVDSHHVDCHDC